MRVVIAGGGTAGWMAAAGIISTLDASADVVLIESDDIPTVGVGEATIPPLLTFHRLIKLPELQFIRAVNGTFKLGINFENWRVANESYFHSFGDTGKGCWAAGFQHFWLKGKQQGISHDYGEYNAEVVAAMAGKFAALPDKQLNYAYHFDAGRYAQLLRNLSEQRGVKRIEGKIEQVLKHPNSGEISGLRLQNGTRVEGDFFIDCTGFRALLIGEALGVKYDDWTHWLPANRAVAVQSELGGRMPPYTRSIAHEVGWQWQIPLQHRMGNGLVFSDQFQSEDEATNTLLANLPGKPVVEPKVIRFTTGQRKTYWEKNCLALGLASGFIEPLESTSIHLVQQGLIWFLTHFPFDKDNDSHRLHYNAQMRKEVDYIRDFIILHYHLNERDEPFWRYCREMAIPESLSNRIALFRETGRVFKPEDDLFAENSWIQVMMGQGVYPQRYHPIVDQMDSDQLQSFLEKVRQEVASKVTPLPTHQGFIDKIIA